MTQQSGHAKFSLDLHQNKKKSAKTFFVSYLYFKPSYRKTSAPHLSACKARASGLPAVSEELRSQNLEPAINIEIKLYWSNIDKLYTFHICVNDNNDYDSNNDNNK